MRRPLDARPRPLVRDRRGVAAAAFAVAILAGGAVAPALPGARVGPALEVGPRSDVRTRSGPGAVRGEARRFYRRARAGALPACYRELPSGRLARAAEGGVQVLPGPGASPRWAQGAALAAARAELRAAGGAACWTPTADGRLLRLSERRELLELRSYGPAVTLRGLRPALALLGLFALAGLLAGALSRRPPFRGVLLAALAAGGLFALSWVAEAGGPGVLLARPARIVDGAFEGRVPGWLWVAFLVGGGAVLAAVAATLARALCEAVAQRRRCDDCGDPRPVAPGPCPSCGALHLETPVRPSALAVAGALGLAYGAALASVPAIHPPDAAGLVPSSFGWAVADLPGGGAWAFHRTRYVVLLLPAFVAVPFGLAYRLPDGLVSAAAAVPALFAGALAGALAAAGTPGAAYPQVVLGAVHAAAFLPCVFLGLAAAQMGSRRSGAGLDRLASRAEDELEAMRALFRSLGGPPPVAVSPRRPTGPVPEVALPGTVSLRAVRRAALLGAAVTALGLAAALCWAA